MQWARLLLLTMNFLISLARQSQDCTSKVEDSRSWVLMNNFSEKQPSNNYELSDFYGSIASESSAELRFAELQHC